MSTDQTPTKAGFSNRTELIKLAALLKSRGARREHAAFSLGLTRTEHEVLQHLRTGMSNQQIARLRDTSPRTIANQVAAILRKTQLPSRRALTTLMV